MDFDMRIAWWIAGGVAMMVFISNMIALAKTARPRPTGRRH
jgi:hypothetical protein